MFPTIALDLTCLFLAPLSRTPRGIDRVELAYARHFLNSWPGDCVAVLPTLWGIRFFDRSRSIRGIESVEAIWREKIDVVQDNVYAAAKRFIEKGVVTSNSYVAYAQPNLREKLAGFIQIISEAGFTFGSSCSRSLPKNSIYLNVGQLEILRIMFTWLYRRSDVVPVFMIYDVIPIEFPEYHVDTGVKLHRAIMRNAAEFAGGLIFPSHAACKSAMHEFLKLSSRKVATHVEHLPVPAEFFAAPNESLLPNHANYFLACGVIDSHKNYILLLRVWEKLIAKYGEFAPRLVIVGYPSVTSEQTIKFLADRPSMQGHVQIASGLSTPALHHLMIGARALLMPSIAEGFGLPIVEALAQGTPVIASDIPAHREAGAGGDVTFIASNDDDGWLARVDTFHKSSKRDLARTYRPKTWTDYFKGVEQFLLDTLRARLANG